MPFDVSTVTQASGAGTVARLARAASAPDAASFADSLGKLIDTVETTQGDANTAVVDMLDGSGEVHDAMIALQRAEMTLQLTVQIRNKLVQAYQDVMRMSIEKSQTPNPKSQSPIRGQGEEQDVFGTAISSWDLGCGIGIS